MPSPILALVSFTLRFHSRTKKKDIYVISTPRRPVPLEHFLYAGRELHKIVDAQGQFLGSGYVSHTDSVSQVSIELSRIATKTLVKPSSVSKIKSVLLLDCYQLYAWAHGVQLRPSVVEASGVVHRVEVMGAAEADLVARLHEVPSSRIVTSGCISLVI